MRLLLRLREPLRAAAVHVRRRGGGVSGAPVNLRSKPGAPPADVRLAAVHRQRQAAEVGESRVVTVADHPDRRWGLVHRSLGLSRSGRSHYLSAHRGNKRSITANCDRSMADVSAQETGFTGTWLTPPGPASSRKRAHQHDCGSEGRASSARASSVSDSILSLPPSSSVSLSLSLSPRGRSWKEVWETLTPERNDSSSSVWKVILRRMRMN